MNTSVNLPVWAIGFFITLLLAFIGGLVAHVRAFARLGSTVEHFSEKVHETNSGLHALSDSVNELNKVVLLLAKDVAKIDSLENDVNRIKHNLRIL